MLVSSHFIYGIYKEDTCYLETYHKIQMSMMNAGFLSAEYSILAFQ